MMLTIAEQRPSGASVWSLRLALFAVALAGATLLLHRLLGMPTPVAISTFAASFAIAGLSLAVAVGASIQIWRDGSRGVAVLLGAGFLSSALLAWPAAYLPIMGSLPQINDVSTDVASPPAFVAALKQRPPDANPLQNKGPDTALAQQRAYPDLQPFFIDRSLDDAFDLALDAAKRMKFKIVSAEPPGGTAGASAGYIEANDRTLVIGFTDDIVIRITGNERTARVDVRSASRYGRHDMGRNADRVRRYLRELLTRIENTVPGAPGSRVRRDRSAPAPAAKAQTVRDRILEARRKQQDRAPPDARRGPAPKAKQQ